MHAGKSDVGLQAFSAKDFAACFDRALSFQFGGETFYVISHADLIIEKKASAKYSDIYDLHEVELIWNRDYKEAFDD